MWVDVYKSKPGPYLTVLAVKANSFNKNYVIAFLNDDNQWTNQLGHIETDITHWQYFEYFDFISTSVN